MLKTTSMLLIFLILPNISFGNTFEKIDFRISFRTNIANEYVKSLSDVPIVPIIYGDVIDGTDYDGKINNELFKKALDDTITNSHDSLIFDWEGAPYRSLINDDNTKKEYIESFSKAIDVAKSYKKIQVGYYGFPSRKSYDLQLLELEKKKLKKLFDKIDILYPSLYLNYKGKGFDPIKTTEKRLNNILDLYCGSKSIYVFIYHRWHPKSNEKHKDKLIPHDIFKKYIQKLTNIKTNENCGIDGIILWGADYHWRHKKKRIAEKIESTMESYFIDTVLPYIRIIKEQISN